MMLQSSTELLLLPDGRVMVHNLTPAFAKLLRELNPGDEQIQPRVLPDPHYGSAAPKRDEVRELKTDRAPTP